MKIPSVKLATTAIIALTISTATVFAPIASAQETVSFEFNYTPEELNTEAGAQDVLNRLENSAKKACKVTSERLTLFNQQIANSCVKTTMENAMQTIAAPQLVAQYENKHAAS